MVERTRMRASRLALVVTLALLSIVVLARAQDGVGSSDGGSSDAGPQGTILDFHTMTPVSGPFIGSASPIRGVNGATQPYTIAHGDGTVRADGQVEVNVTRLVLAEGSAMPVSQQGTNPNSTFTVIVSCASPTASSQASNVSAPPAPANLAGTAQIQAKVALPNPCLAPLLFITGPDGAWIAVTGAPPSPSDGGTPDAGTDGGTPDAGTDGGTPDAGTDGGMPDAGTADGGM